VTDQLAEARCAACGEPGHSYGRNEGMERYDPMACINTLRGRLEACSSITDERISQIAVAMDGYSDLYELTQRQIEDGFNIQPMMDRFISGPTVGHIPFSLAHS